MIESASYKDLEQLAKDIYAISIILRATIAHTFPITDEHLMNLTNSQKILNSISNKYKHLLDETVKQF